MGRPTDDFTRHGGQLHAAMRAWPEAPRPWIDLSTGINPRPYPAPRASRAARARLPFPEETAALEAVAAAAFGIEDPARIVATPGAEAALRLLPRILGAETAAIAGPTYASHAQAWSTAGVRLVRDADAAKVLVVVNPNNPDGRRYDREALVAQADGLGARGGWLIVDESFADAETGASIAALGHPAIIALRSFGKFYGLAGLRLGFVLGEPGIIDKVRALQGDWPVSADALAAGRAAYTDSDWTARTRPRLARDSAWLDAALTDAGFRWVGGTTLFRLVEAEDAPRRFAALCERGVLTRPFTAAPTWLRFGLPPRSARRRVAEALRSLG
ncbi:MAG TPA: threonine-phosphate decarboxylase CobD [Caulobacteraceae bacterium]|jgi:cobalamin biosynthetic protein CobC|nr:threonine-phosphate decarboxylase CobD [Caulobacteraceae bacterium]